MNGQEDLTHTNWLLFSQEQLIRLVNPAISTRIINLPDKNYLVASNISEADITRIFLLTNTDVNNNYLYLESFKVFLDNAPDPLNIPGLEDNILDIVRKADIISFVANNKVSYPFSKNLFNNSTINQFIDNYTNLIPNSPKTYNRIKTYTIVLNPDLFQMDPNNNNNQSHIWGPPVVSSTQTTQRRQFNPLINM
jgi:hypothetical protein